MKKLWYRGTLRFDLFDLKQGDVVAIRPTSLKHSLIGQTFWILSLKKKRLYHVATEFAGPEARYLVSIEREAKNQELCESEAKELARFGQFSKPEQIQALLKRTGKLK